MNVILDRLTQDKQVSVARFNDGEIGAMIGDLDRTSRNEQEVTPELKEGLLEAIKYRSEGYFIGYPCPECYHVYSEYARVLTRDTKNIILATFATNHNYHVFTNNLLQILRRKNWCYVADRYIPDLGGKFYRCPSEDAFEQSEKILHSLGTHDVYVLTCGAASRYLAMRLHKEGKSALDLGSIFDPLKGKKRRNGKPINAHVWPTKYRNETDYCPVCNQAGKM